MEFRIEGGSFPVVICKLQKGESMLCENGAMSWMSYGWMMDTTSHGGARKALSRAMTGEKMFLNRYISKEDGGMIAFSSCFPGVIKQFGIDSKHEIIVQKSSYLCSTDGIETSVFFQKKLRTGFFGGEGFIMQKVSGEGIIFVEFDGYVKEYALEKGQQMIVSTSNLAGIDATCSMDIEAVPGMKNMLFGGEGMFYTTVKGPGRVWVQSMPISELARTVSSYLPSQTGNVSRINQAGNMNTAYGSKRR